VGRDPVGHLLGLSSSGALDPGPGLWGRGCLAPGDLVGYVEGRWDVLPRDKGEAALTGMLATAPGHERSPVESNRR